MKRKTSITDLWVNKLLQRVCKPELLEEIEGDLLELYQEWVKNYGPKKAKRLYLFHAIKFLRPFALKKTSPLDSLKPNFMLQNHLKIAWRQLFRRRSHAFFNISGLVLGILSFIMISLWIWDEVSFDSYHANQSQVARVLQNQTFDEGVVQTWRAQALQLAPVLRNTYGNNFKYVSMASFQNEYTLFFKENGLKQMGMFIETSAPYLLSLEMLHGRREDFDGINSIFISESLAKAFFGENDPMQKILKIEDFPELQVKGVYQDLPHNSTFAGLQFIASWEVYQKSLPEWVGWGNSWFQALVQIDEHKTMEEASLAIRDAKLDHMSKESGERYKPQLFLHPMTEWHLYNEFKHGKNIGGRIQYIWMFGVIGIFILGIAGINFVNLSTAQSEKRAKEVGIRKAIGSSKFQLISQFLVESLFLTTIASVIALLLVQILLPIFNYITGKELGIPWTNYFFWLSMIGFTFFLGLLSGSYPAFYVSSFRAHRILKGSIYVGKSSRLPRNILVCIQFTISLTLIIGTVFVFQQIQHVKNRPIGYEVKDLITIPIVSGEIQDRRDVFRNDLLQSKHVQEVSWSSAPINLTLVTNSGMTWSGKDPELNEEFVTVKVSHEFGKTVGWQLTKGRDFSRDFASDKLGMVINEAAATYLGFKEPIGKKIKWGNHGTYTILGVVKNMISQSPYEPAKQTLFFLEYKGPSQLNLANIKLKPSSNPKEALRKIESTFQKYHKQNIFDYQFIDEAFAQKFVTEEKIGQLSSIFAILTILISCMGLYGLAAWITQYRNKEIGVRKVLGASSLGIWILLLREFLLILLIACGGATILASYFVSQWLDQFEYHTSLSIWVFVMAYLIILGITLTTVSYKTIRAALQNPVKILRTE